MSIKTKYGTASISSHGYYEIRSNEHGFRGHKLHRLIMADAIGCGIPSNYVVHHIDGDKLNNNLNNLELLTWEKHTSLHKKDKPQQSRTSNYFRVYKEKDSNYKKGYKWVYQYYDNNKRKRIMSVNIEKLKKKVRAKGLEWRKL